MKLRALLYVGILITFLAIVPVVNAQQVARPKKGLQVSPLRAQLALDPGSTTIGKLALTNDTDKQLDVELSSENFGVINEQYDYKFAAEESSKWIRFVEETASLKPNERKEIGYSIAIPANAPPGGYDIALIAAIQEPPSTSAVNEYRRVASLVYLDVVGEVQKKGKLLAFDVPWYSSNQVTSYQFRAANQGNTHLEFDVRVESDPIGPGNTEKTKAKTLTLPTTVRVYSGDLQIGTLPGIYSVTATYTPPAGRTNVIKKTIIYAPPSFLVGLALVLGAAGYGIITLINIKRHPKYAAND